MVVQPDLDRVGNPENRSSHDAAHNAKAGFVMLQLRLTLTPVTSQINSPVTSQINSPVVLKSKSGMTSKFLVNLPGREALLYHRFPVRNRRI